MSAPVQSARSSMHPKHHAQTKPDAAAYVMAATGETVTYRQLDEMQV